MDLSIGDFSRATHMSVKMLRNYHEIGLLEPAAVDPQTGYRRYSLEQIPSAQVIRRFRALDMPLDRIRAVLAAPDLEERNTQIAEHLATLEAELSRTQEAVTSLRELLEGPASAGELAISFRRAEPVAAAAIREVTELAGISLWYQGAIGEILASLAAQDLPAAGPPVGIYSDELLRSESGEAIIFVPHHGRLQPAGRVQELEIPGAELATLVHCGPQLDIDRSYGALGAYVADHALAVDGPIREYYVVSRRDTPDTSAWRTEICWPVFRTVASDDR